jgi:hypothetical protein
VRNALLVTAEACDRSHRSLDVPRRLVWPYPAVSRTRRVLVTDSGIATAATRGGLLRSPIASGSFAGAHYTTREWTLLRVDLWG